MPTPSTLDATFPFYKMHGLGNDFIVFDNRDGSIPTDAAFLTQLADRHFGIGCDQILMVTKPPVASADFGYAIFNGDGSAVGQCGNGARCLAHFIHHLGISDKPTLKLSTSTTSMSVTRINNAYYSVTMPSPDFDPQHIPFTPAEGESEPPYTLDNYPAACYIANVGNPHAIFALNDVGYLPDLSLAMPLSSHHQFSEGANVSFMTIHQPDHISLVVFERGAGTTLACGSAACAAMAVGRRYC